MLINISHIQKENKIIYHIQNVPEISKKKMKKREFNEYLINLKTFEELVTAEDMHPIF